MTMSSIPPLTNHTISHSLYGNHIKRTTIEYRNMRIAVMGSGGQGGLFGSVLSRAGHDGTFIARGKNLEIIQSKGFTLRSKIFGDFKVQVHATDNPESVDEVDLILFCVKNYDLDTAAEQIKPMIGSETIVLTVQNGVEAPDRIGDIIGSEHVFSCWIG